jgi:hypothetical protein
MYNKAIKTVLLVFLGILPSVVWADKHVAAKNFCHNLNENKDFNDLLNNYPTDKGVIRLFAMRQGLCELMDKQRISLELGIHLWAVERQKILIERTKTELNRLSK